MADTTTTMTEPPTQSPSRKRRRTPTATAAKEGKDITKPSTTTTSPLTPESPRFAPEPPKRKKPTKRNLPPHVQSLYQQLESTTQESRQVTREKELAQQLLQQAQQRLANAELRSVQLDRFQLELEESLLQAELSIESDFSRHYNQLQQFQEHHGHCNVHTVSNHPLAEWSKKMRRVRSQSLRGKHYQNAPWPYYLKALERIGFCWDAVSDLWRTQFEKLLSYRAEAGHCCIPKSHAPDKSLGAWVHRQRYHYKLYHEGKPTQLTVERIRLLDSVGFAWTVKETSSDRPIPVRPRKKGTRRTAQEEWEYYYKQLVDFQKEYGHLKTSAMGDQNRNNQLRDWVAWQRREYVRWNRGEPSHVTSEHVRRLTEIGFNWQVHPRDKSKKSKKSSSGKISGGSDNGKSSGESNDNNNGAAVPNINQDEAPVTHTRDAVFQNNPPLLNGNDHDNHNDMAVPTEELQAATIDSYVTL